MVSHAGRPTYPPERERIFGEEARQETERLATTARRRGRKLGLAYSLSLAATFLLFVTDTLHAGGV